MAAEWLGPVASLCGWLQSKAHGFCLTVAEDCAGIGPLGHVLDQLNVKYRLAWVCDYDVVCQEILSKQGRAEQILTDMRARAFKGDRMCARNINGEAVTFGAATLGLQLYLSCISCKPFSKKGLRTGYRHPEAPSLFQSLRPVFQKLIWRIIPFSKWLATMVGNSHT